MLSIDDLTKHLKRIFDTVVRPGNLMVNPLSIEVGTIQTEIDLVNQSAAGQPLEAALSTPIAQGYLPLLAILSEREIKSFQVWGMEAPAA